MMNKSKPNLTPTSPSLTVFSCGLNKTGKQTKPSIATLVTCASLPNTSFTTTLCWLLRISVREKCTDDDLCWLGFSSGEQRGIYERDAFKRRGDPSRTSPN